MTRESLKIMLFPQGLFIRGLHLEKSHSRYQFWHKGKSSHWAQWAWSSWAAGRWNLKHPKFSDFEDLLPSLVKPSPFPLRTVDRAFALQMADLGLIPDTPGVLISSTPPSVFPKKKANKKIEISVSQAHSSADSSPLISNSYSKMEDFDLILSKLQDAFLPYSRAWQGWWRKMGSRTSCLKRKPGKIAACFPPWLTVKIGDCTLFPGVPIHTVPSKLLSQTLECYQETLGIWISHSTFPERLEAFPSYLRQRESTRVRGTKVKGSCWIKSLNKSLRPQLIPTNKHILCHCKRRKTIWNQKGKCQRECTKIETDWT